MKLKVWAPTLVMLIVVAGLILAAHTIWQHSPPGADMRALEPLSDQRR